MQIPKRTRRGIPFYYEKTEDEFRNDAYEYYEEHVQRQTRIHLCDDFIETYPFQQGLDFFLKNINKPNIETIVDIGCGVGRLIGEIAIANPATQCYGIDYSYQMLRRASEYWREGKILNLDFSSKGFSEIELKGKRLQNLHLGLAKAEQLPFDDASIDIVCNSFLLDRVDSLTDTLNEIYRVLKSGGTFICLSPLNFSKKEKWTKYGNEILLSQAIKNIGFPDLSKPEIITLNETLDRHSFISWRCVGIVAIKD